MMACVSSSPSDVVVSRAERKEAANTPRRACRSLVRAERGKEPTSFSMAGIEPAGTGNATRRGGGLQPAAVVRAHGSHAPAGSSIQTARATQSRNRSRTAGEAGEVRRLAPAARYAWREGASSSTRQDRASVSHLDSGEADPPHFGWKLLRSWPERQG